MEESEASWKKKCQRLVAFKKATGGFNLPRSHDLYSWLSGQNFLFKNGIYDSNCYRTLCMIGVNVELYDCTENSTGQEVDKCNPILGGKHSADAILTAAHSTTCSPSTLDSRAVGDTTVRDVVKAHGGQSGAETSDYFRKPANRPQEATLATEEQGSSETATISIDSREALRLGADQGETYQAVIRTPVSQPIECSMSTPDGGERQIENTVSQGSDLKKNSACDVGEWQVQSNAKNNAHSEILCSSGKSPLEATPRKLSPAKHLVHNGTTSPPSTNFRQSKSRQMKQDEVWNKIFEELKEYRRTHGHLEVPRTVNLDLARWLYQQRYRRKSGTLNPERYKKLAELGFNFELKSRKSDSPSPSIDKTENRYQMRTEARWLNWLQELTKFKQENGHVNVSQEKNSDLYAWLSRQWDLFEEGYLREDRLELLSALGFETFRQVPESGTSHDKTPVVGKVCLSQRGKSDANFLHRIEELKKFKEENGHVIVPLRRSYRQGTLEQDRYQMLLSLGYDAKVQLKQGADSRDLISPERQDEFDNKFKELQRYKDEYVGEDGSFEVSQTSNRPLYQWVCQQRSLYLRGQLSDDRKESLTALGLNLNHKDQRKTTTFDKSEVAKQDRQQSLWEAMYDELKWYYDERGHANIKHSDKPGLFAWIQKQREALREGELQPERVERLSNVGVVLTELSTGEGPSMESSIDSEDEDGVRQPPRSGTVMSLSSRGATNKKRSGWLEWFDELANFKQRHGHFRVPSDESLYQWTYRQRKEYSTGTLPDDKIALLESIDFDFEKRPVKRRKQEEVPYTVRHFRPPRAIARNIPSPDNCMATFTSVYTSDLDDLILGMKTGSVDMKNAISQLEEMRRGN